MNPFYKSQELTADIRHALDRDAAVIHFPNPTLTQQHHAHDADLNTIVKRYGITDGAIPPMALDPKYFGDFTDAVDFREALERVRNAEARFNALPAATRALFDNDPTFMHEWVFDPANAEEAVKLGLLQKQTETPAPTARRDPETGKEKQPEARA